jgi:phosphoribosylcarboxyaminoimidazole (NCAIR) mutase
MTPPQVITAKDLARTIGVPVTELQTFANQNQLPFVVTPNGFGISTADIGTWKLAALLAARAQENAT